MNDIIEIYYSDLADALYYFEYHGPNYNRIRWLEKDKRVRDVYKLIREIKFPRFKNFLPYARNLAAMNNIDSPRKLAKFIVKNPPKGKAGELWEGEFDKMSDILQEIYNFFLNEILTKEVKKEHDRLRKDISKKYSKYWKKLKEESEKIPGIIWKRKEPSVCLLYPLSGKLSHKLKFSGTAYIESSQEMLNDESLFLHEVVKLLNYTRPIGVWVRQDRRGIRAIAYEIYTELQTLKLVNAVFNKKPNYKRVIDEKLYNIWIPTIRMETSFDKDELERILQNAYKIITKHEFDSMYQIGEIYTELNIILLT